jgi:hypothetical protein
MERQHAVASERARRRLRTAKALLRTGEAQVREDLRWRRSAVSSARSASRAEDAAREAERAVSAVRACQDTATRRRAIEKRRASLVLGECKPRLLRIVRENMRKREAAMHSRTSLRWAFETKGDGSDSSDGSDGEL